MRLYAMLLEFRHERSIFVVSPFRYVLIFTLIDVHIAVGSDFCGWSTGRGHHSLCYVADRRVDCVWSRFCSVLLETTQRHALYELLLLRGKRNHSLSFTHIHNTIAYHITVIVPMILLHVFCLLHNIFFILSFSISYHQFNYRKKFNLPFNLMFLIGKKMIDNNVGQHDNTHSPHNIIIVSKRGQVA